MPNFRGLIQQAYAEILQRPADSGGLEHYNSMMNAAAPATLTEAQLRESLLRSVEYATRFPESGPLPPPQMRPLTVVGNRFVSVPDGASVRLLGMVVCCDDPETSDDEALARGWPLIDEDTLDLIADHKLNYTVMRLGPSIQRDIFPGVIGGEGAEFVGYALRDGRYDLDQWDQSYWDRVRALGLHAASRGIYVCYSLVDSWLLDHQLTPWQPERNHQGFSAGSLAVVREAPNARHTDWIQKCVATVGDLPNTLFLDGNESFKGRPSIAWIHGIRDIVADELARRGWSDRLFATNSGITESVDFIVLHDRSIPPPGDLPIVVDEYETRSVDAILADARLGWEQGSVSYIYWRGEHAWEESLRCLDGLTAIVDGTVTPWPDSCPTLTKCGLTVHHWIQANGEPTQGRQPDNPPPGARKGVFDYTPKFGDPPRPCNDEHPERCEGRPCEDPRGGVWTLVEAPAGVEGRIDDNPFLFHVSPLPPGFYRLRVEPHPDSQDALGKLHQVSPNAPRELSWSVG